MEGRGSSHGQTHYRHALYVHTTMSGVDFDLGFVLWMAKAHGHGDRRRSFAQWNSGICACCDDPQSCCIGLLCPCYVYGRNAEILGSGSFVGSCLAHCILWGGSTALCCLVTDGILLGLSGCVVGGYAYRYRRALRSKYNLPEEPCGDFTTHACCHLCAICQEYREIPEATGSFYLRYLHILLRPPTTKTAELNASQAEISQVPPRPEPS
ncbi:hypothetical protein Syun_002759 [Stephania yunnanensis]|uniref:Uncharacterized protein n=1 Tax=Stephania yunnanensis TaxID=152371 RepID=A0AAP0Q932_9MAGN